MYNAPNTYSASPLTDHHYAYDPMLPKHPRFTMPLSGNVYNELSTKYKTLFRPTNEDMRAMADHSRLAGYQHSGPAGVDIETAFRLVEQNEAEVEIENNNPEVIDRQLDRKRMNTISEQGKYDPEKWAQFQSELLQKKEQIMKMNISSEMKTEVLREAYKQTYMKYFINATTPLVDPLTGKRIEEQNRIANAQMLMRELPVELEPEMEEYARVPFYYYNDHDGFVEQKTRAYYPDTRTISRYDIPVGKESKYFNAINNNLPEAWVKVRAQERKDELQKMMSKAKTNKELSKMIEEKQRSFTERKKMTNAEIEDLRKMGLTGQGIKKLREQLLEKFPNELPKKERQLMENLRQRLENLNVPDQKEREEKYPLAVKNEDKPTIQPTQLFNEISNMSAEQDRQMIEDIIKHEITTNYSKYIKNNGLNINIITSAIIDIYDNTKAREKSEFFSAMRKLFKDYRDKKIRSGNVADIKFLQNKLINCPQIFEKVKTLTKQLTVPTMWVPLEMIYNPLIEIERTHNISTHSDAIDISQFPEVPNNIAEPVAKRKHESPSKIKRRSKRAVLMSSKMAKLVAKRKHESPSKIKRRSKRAVLMASKKK
jgi:hypothetical protein